MLPGPPWDLRTANSVKPEAARPMPLNVAVSARPPEGVTVSVADADPAAIGANSISIEQLLLAWTALSAQRLDTIENWPAPAPSMATASFALVVRPLFFSVNFVAVEELPTSTEPKSLVVGESDSLAPA